MCDEERDSILRPIASCVPALLCLVLVTTVACSRETSPPTEDLGVGDGEASAPSSEMQETPEERDNRMAWWRDARFGMFIHWGLYAVPAGEYKRQRSDRTGEWIMEWANIPRAEYETFADDFNPVGFDAAEWVRIAEDAGMKYIVITSKHHDGFAMYDSKVSDYDIVDRTPYEHDVLKALSDEARKAGLRFAVYHSIMDSHHPSQYVDAEGKDPTAGHGVTQIKDGQKQQYVDYMKTQLREIVTQHDPAILWFDGEWVGWWTEADGKNLYAYVRDLKADIIINNRVGKGRKGMEGSNKDDQKYAGDFGTPEQQIPPSGLPGVDWETCMTMNDTWGFKSYDDNWKSAQTLIRNLIDAASKGGNYLLNVGPTAEGRIPSPSVERLAAMGKWLRANGDAIYGTQASPYQEQLSWGRVTTTLDKLYLHVFDWPTNGELSMPAVPAEHGSAAKAYLLADTSTTLEVSSGGDSITIRLPQKPPDPDASVIVVELSR